MGEHRPGAASAAMVDPDAEPGTVSAMSNPFRFFHRLAHDERGMTTVEYVIALCLVGAVAVGLWGKFGNTIRTSLGKADSLIETDTEAAIVKGSSTSLDEE